MATWILGTGGHARALTSLVSGEMTDVNPVVKPEDRVVIGVGDIPNRKRLFRLYEIYVIGVGEQWRAGITTEAGQGCQFMPRSIVMPYTEIGVNVLVNTGAQIDHDCKIGDHCVISPGAILCGGVTLGEMCYVSAGAVILQNVTLDDETYVPPGAVVYGQDDIRVPTRAIPHLGTVKA